MTVVPSIDPARFLDEHLAQASPDLLREMLTTFINALLSADADSVCGAAYGAVSEERINRRNGYRHCDFDTRAGTIDVAIPKLRQGSYFPDWLLERRRRAEQALTTVVANCYLLGGERLTLVDPATPWEDEREQMAAALKNSSAKSRADTASMLFAIGRSNPSVEAVMCRSMGKPVPASAAAPSGLSFSRARESTNRPRSRPNISK